MWVEGHMATTHSSGDITRRNEDFLSLQGRQLDESWQREGKGTAAWMNELDEYHVYPSILEACVSRCQSQAKQSKQISNKLALGFCCARVWCRAFAVCLWRKFAAMAKGSQSQASTTTSRASGGSSGGAVPRSNSAGAPPKGTGSAGLRRRRTASSGSGGGGFSGGNNSNMLRFYTDDAPGLKITPTVVLVMSVCFIGFVTALHVVGKLYNYRSGGASA